jgi:hypothetical protein
MDQAGRQFLAAARLARDMNRGLAACHPVDQLAHLFDRRGLAKQVGLAIRAVSRIRTGQIQGGLDDAAQLVERHRLSDVVECAGLECRHRILGTAVGGNHGHRQVGRGLGDAAYQVQSFAIREAHVGQAQLITLADKHLPRLGKRTDTIRQQPHACQGEIEQLADVRLIVYHQHALGFTLTAGATFALH